MGTTTSTTAQRNLSASELGAWGGMLRMQILLTRQLDAELSQQHGITTSDYEVLMFLAHAPQHRMRMSELSESALISQSGVTRLVDRLERRGLIERQDCPDDRRGQFAVLTDTGYRTIRDASVTHVSGIRDSFLRHLDESEQEMLGAFWERIMPGTGDALSPLLRSASSMTEKE